MVLKHSQGREPLFYSCRSPETLRAIPCAWADLSLAFFPWLIPADSHPAQESLPPGSPLGHPPPHPSTGLLDYPRLAFTRTWSFCILIVGLLQPSPSLGLEFLLVGDFIFPPCNPWSQAGSGTLQALSKYSMNRLIKTRPADLLWVTF